MIERASDRGGELDLGGGGRLALPAGDGDVEVRYTGLAFDAPTQLRFRHRLRGLDDVWVEAGPRRSVTYTNLPPGDYAFEVTVQNMHGLWSPPARLRFTIAPHLWQTRWFQLAAGVAGVLLVVGLVQLRIRAVRHRNRALQAEVIERQHAEARALEQERHYRTLFERTTTGALLTAAGEKLVPAAEDMGRALGELGVALDAVEAEAEGVVRLTAPPGVADVFVAPALVRFHARHPRVRVDLDASVGYADLTRGEADLALRVRRPERGDLLAQRLVTTRSLPATAPAYAAELGTLRALDDARWIAWGHDLAQIPEARWIAAHVGAPPVLRTSSFSAQLAAATTGLGLVLAPEPYLPRFGLAAVRPGRKLAAAWAALPIGELWLVGHVALRRVPRVAALWQFVVDELTGPWAAPAR